MFSGLVLVEKRGGRLKPTVHIQNMFTVTRDAGKKTLNVAKLFFQELFIHCNLFFNIFLPFSFCSFFLINLFKSVGSVEMLTKAKRSTPSFVPTSVLLLVCRD